MNTPDSLDPDPVWVGKEIRPRPPVTGVIALLRTQRGVTRLRYPCVEGEVLIKLDWKLTDDEKIAVDQAAGLDSGEKDHAATIAKAIGDSLLCGVSFWIRPGANSPEVPL